MKKNKYLIIVGFGPVAGYKYSRCIRNAIDSGDIKGYSIIDLESQKHTVIGRIADLPAQPDNLYLLPDTGFEDGSNASIAQFDDICNNIKKKNNCDLKIVITTEPQAHEVYLNYCISNHIDSLVTKPINIPMENDRINHQKIVSSFKKLITKTNYTKGNHAALCLSRHHEIYNQGVFNPIINKMKILDLPITSLRLNTSSGVWNLNNEFEERNDHPYKYGYGMLYHGGYHYIDLIAQALILNRLVYPNQEFLLELSSFSAFPSDQDYRIPETIVKNLHGFRKTEQINLNNTDRYGETDLVTSFCLKMKKTNKVITLGNIALEQTTPGMRSWFDFPEVPYNINGRLHSTDFNIQLSTLYSVNGHVVKVPIGARKSNTDLRGKNIGIITTRSNATLTGDQEFYKQNMLTRPYGNSYSYSAETQIFEKWILGEDTQSDLISHLPSITLLEALSKSIVNNGEKILIDFSFEVPNYIKNMPIKNQTFNQTDRIRFAAYE